MNEEAVKTVYPDNIKACDVITSAVPTKDNKLDHTTNEAAKALKALIILIVKYQIENNGNKSKKHDFQG